MRLEPLAYQHLLVTWIEKELTKVWDWFRSHAVRVEQTSATRLELLKTTYRLEASHAERVYRAAHQAAEALEIAFPITIYQSQRRHAECVARSDSGGSACGAARSGARNVERSGIDSPLRPRAGAQPLVERMGHPLSDRA